MTAEVQIDRRGIDRLIARSRRLQGIKVRAGAMGPSGGPARRHSGSDLTNAELLAIHEFGLGVPELPIIRSVMQGQRREVAEAMLEGAARALGGASDDEVAKAVGEPVADLIRDRIEKAGPGGLVEGGELRDSIDWTRER